MLFDSRYRGFARRAFELKNQGLKNQGLGGGRGKVGESRSKRSMAMSKIGDGCMGARARARAFSNALPRSQCTLRIGQQCLSL